MFQLPYSVLFRGSCEYLIGASFLCCQVFLLSPLVKEFWFKKKEILLFSCADELKKCHHCNKKGSITVIRFRQKSFTLYKDKFRALSNIYDRQFLQIYLMAKSYAFVDQPYIATKCWKNNRPITIETIFLATNVQAGFSFFSISYNSKQPNKKTPEVLWFLSHHPCFFNLVTFVAVKFSSYKDTVGCSI